MRYLRHSLLPVVLSGISWGAVTSITIAVVLTFTTKTSAVPPLGAGIICGTLSSLLVHLLDATNRNRILTVVACFLAFMVLTSGAPFGNSFFNAPLPQGIGAALFAILVMLANTKCLKGMKWGLLNRYDFEKYFIRIAIGLGFVFFTGIVVLPFYIMVMTSLKSQQVLLANPLDYSIDLGRGFQAIFRSYVELFTEYQFGTFLLNTTLVSVASTLITLLFSVPGAYAVARLRFRGRKTMSRSILLIYMVPAIVLVIPLYSVFSQLGLRNTLSGLLLVYPATTIPVALYMLQGYFRGLPYELEEAGLMDGLSRLQVIIKIALPLAVPALATVSLYVFMIAWNEFLFAFMFLDDTKLFTLSRGIVSLNSSEVPRQHLMAGAVIATIPILALFLWFERFLVQGLTAGSVKG